MCALKKKEQWEEEEEWEIAWNEQVDRLHELLEPLNKSSLFCTAGSREPIIPRLQVDEVGEISLPVQPPDAKRLIEVSEQAPYGRGEETVLDTEVRRVWQIDARQISFVNPKWETFMDDLVIGVCDDFDIDEEVEYELYKLLIYEEGCFFTPHRDTEKVDGMFATLVVSLPSQHDGGSLHIHHDGQTKVFESGGPSSAEKIQFSAFYADCQHEVLPVTSGYRVCLIYNLSIPQREKQPKAPHYAHYVDHLVSLLPELFLTGDLVKAAIPLKHQYSGAGIGIESLKGVDRTLLEIFSEASERLGFVMHLALIKIWQNGYPDDDTMPYDYYSSRYYSRRRYWEDDDEEEEDNNDYSDVEMAEVFSETMELDDWLTQDGRPVDFGPFEIEREELFYQGDFSDFLYTQEVEEASGNAGASMDRWYRHGMIVLWPKSEHRQIIMKEGQKYAVPALEEICDSNDAPQSRECHSLAQVILDEWIFHKTIPEDELTHTTRMLKCLHLLEDAELIERFILEVLSIHQSGDEGSILAQICEDFGWWTFFDALNCLFELPEPKEGNLKLQNLLAIFEGLCSSFPELSDEQDEVCSELAVTLVEALFRWDEHKAPSIANMIYEKLLEARLHATHSFFCSLRVLEQDNLIKRYLSHLLKLPKHYELHHVLLPLVHEVFAWESHSRKDLHLFLPLLHHCIQQFEKLTARPVPPPQNWRVETNISCACPNCRALQTFLQNPKVEAMRFPLAKEERKHLHRQIDLHRLDVDHVTERTGRPFTLICTKNRATYKKKCLVFNSYVQQLAELQELLLQFE